MEPKWQPKPSKNMRRFSHFDGADLDSLSICELLFVPPHQGECKHRANFQPENKIQQTFNQL